MKMPNNKKCETFLLDDLPANSDAFGSDEDIGPHQRVADAIADLIETAGDGGKAIGLEGDWGAGKSTVVRLFTDRLTGDENDDFAVVLFDAWAHEGDPLRRTFIESTVKKLCDHGWADEEAWNERVEELAKRRKETTTQITPKPTELGKAMAISLLLVPLGTALLSGGFRQSVSLGLGLPPNWFFCLGLHFVLSPICVLVYRWLQLRFKVRSVLPWLVPIGAIFLAQGISSGVCFWGPTPNWSFCFGLALTIWPICDWLLRWNKVRKEPDVGDTSQVTEEQEDEEKTSDWAFLLSRSINETKTKTFETPDPTSIEFSGYFSDLMTEALSETKTRRVVLVLDNLDRVDAGTALSIWGTLQTFLHVRDRDADQWYKQLWVIVPYDPVRLRKLWNIAEEQGVDDDGENDTNESRRTSESFLDKSFQIRFHVSPPVLSNWKTFLYELVDKALPGHEEDRHMIYRVFDHCRAQEGDPPTPRELKLFVNQIGAIHRQWKHEFPMPHVAFFVLARKKHPRIVEALRHDGFLSDSDQRLLGDDLINSLAGLAFNVKAAKGLELLLANSVVKALKSSVPQDLAKIAERNGDGFWAVLESVATSRWHEEDAKGLTKIATQLQATHLLLRNQRPEKPSVMKALREAGTNMKKWMPFYDGLGEGVSQMLRIHQDEEFSTAVLKKFCAQVARVDVVKDEIEDATVVENVLTLFASTEGLGHVAAIPQTITLPFNGEKWISACDVIGKEDSKGYKNRFRAYGKASEVTEAFESKITTGKFGGTHVGAIKVTQSSAIKAEWEGVIQAIQTRLNHAQNAPSNECVHLLSALFQLEHMGVSAATTAPEALCNPGHLLHHFHTAKSQTDHASQAAIILCFARQKPDLSASAVAGNSDVGHRLIDLAATSPEEELTEALYEVARRFSLLPEVLRIVQNGVETHKLFLDVLKMAADSETPEDVFTSEVINSHWHRLRPSLNDSESGSRFQNLVGVLAKSQNYSKELVESDEGFDPSKSLLYLDILRGAKGEVPEFATWCQEGLQRMNKDEWVADFSGNNANCAVCIELTKQKSAPVLANNFSDALQEHGQSVIEGIDIPAKWLAETWSTVVDCIEESSGTRKVLREHLVGTVVAARGEINEKFFDMYGAEIEDTAILAAHDHVLSRFFTPLVTENHERGLSWLDEFANANPDFLGTVKAKHTAQDFTGRLQGLVDNAEDDVSPAIVSIASHFGVEPTPQPEESGESDEEQPAAESDLIEE